MIISKYAIGTCLVYCSMATVDAVGDEIAVAVLAIPLGYLLMRFTQRSLRGQ